MTKVEMEKRIEKLNGQRFYLAMKDVWTRKDFQLDDEWLAEIEELEKKLKEI